MAASVLRNLSWRTDAKSKAALRKVQAASRLTVAVLSTRREPTLRTTLSALWNLSSHCTSNKKAVCRSVSLLVIWIVAEFVIKLLRRFLRIIGLVVEHSGFTCESKIDYTGHVLNSRQCFDKFVLHLNQNQLFYKSLNLTWRYLYANLHFMGFIFLFVSVDGALGFLVSALDVSNPSKGLPIMESSGGILRNLCSVIVTSLEYR